MQSANIGDGADVAALRSKLDAAIMAEAWDAVKVIAERLRAAERETAGNVVPIGKRRGKG